jgi:nucleotide-binding universal stress UspA family protein
MKTYSHILVPLDTSELAELALEDAFLLARLGNSSITLLHVIPPLESIMAAETGHPIFIDQQWDSHKKEALLYLKEICQRHKCPNVKVDFVVETGLVAETIIEFAQEKSVDLIVMATHGRSGLQRWVFGSVADKVLRGADVPVLLVRAHGRQNLSPSEEAAADMG